MKTFTKITLILILFLANKSFTQTAISDVAGYTPNSKAVLDLNSTTKGLLLPRLTTAQRIAIAPTASQTGLSVFDITTKSQWFYDGMAWKEMAGGFSLPYSGTNNNGNNALDINNTVGRAAYFQSPNSLETMRVYNSGTGNALTVDGPLNVTGDLKTNGTTGTSGQVLQNNGNGTLSWTDANDGLILKYPRSKEFGALFDNTPFSVTNYSFTVPANVTKIWVEAWGGGSAGGKLPVTITNTTASKGGKAGGFLTAIITVVPSELLTIEVGNGNSVAEGGTTSIYKNTPSVSAILQCGGGADFFYFLPTNPSTNTNGFLNFVKGEDGQISTESYSQTSATTFVRTIAGGNGGAAFPNQKGGSGATVTYNLATNTMLSNLGVSSGIGTYPGGGGGVAYSTGVSQGAPGLLILHW